MEEMKRIEGKNDIESGKFRCNVISSPSPLELLIFLFFSFDTLCCLRKSKWGKLVLLLGVLEVLLAQIIGYYAHSRELLSQVL